MSTLKRVTILLVAILCIQCAKEDQYLIEKGKVGAINNQTQILDLETIFKKDSIVSTSQTADSTEEKKLFSVVSDEYIIFSMKGKKMLEIVPEKINDSTSTIRSIQIFDPKFITDRGISLTSTFKDINEQYMVNNVETTLTSATLFIDELNATIAIDKKELGLNSFSRDEVTLDQIPDLAKIKYFTIWFN